MHPVQQGGPAVAHRLEEEQEAGWEVFPGQWPEEPELATGLLWGRSEGYPGLVLTGTLSPPSLLLIPATFPFSKALTLAQDPV